VGFELWECRAVTTLRKQDATISAPDTGGGQVCAIAQPRGAPAPVPPPDSL
jgi:hypothetical protein